MELTKLQKNALNNPFYFDQNEKIPGPQFAEIRDFKRYKCSLLLTVNEEEPNRWVWKSSVAASIMGGGVVLRYLWKKSLESSLFRFAKSSLRGVGEDKIKIENGLMTSVVFSKPLTKEEVGFLGRGNVPGD